MPRLKTIYTLKGIFTLLLEDANKKGFLIPAYQRGYKWTSIGTNSHNIVLMRDLIQSFQRGNDAKYYLQFITLKEKNNELEVIDGQQRLTTITVLFRILKFLIQEEATLDFINDKLNYQTRVNFINEYIYKNINFILDSSSWDDFIAIHSDHNNQDVYFIYNAVKAIHNYIVNNIHENKRKEFAQYLSDKVLLIVNLLENDMRSEKIFINVNKGVKLNDVDLIKGMLITKIPIDNPPQQRWFTEIEISELRSNMGRQWDDLSRWSKRADVGNFYNNIALNNNSMEWLIKLAYPEISGNEEENPLFNYIDHLYRSKKENASKIFNKIRHTMLTLNDWLCDSEIYDLLGYILHLKNNIKLDNILKKLNGINTKDQILKTLKELCKRELPLDENGELIELNYEDNKSELYKLFLMIDLSKFLPIANANSIHYDFSKISSGNWSLEHIFPQNAKDFKNVNKLAKADLDIIKELLPSNEEEINIDPSDKKEEILSLYSKIMQSGNECQIFSEEQGYLEILLEKNAKDLHRLGNLALLQREMNSKLSNQYFENKRKTLVSLISNGTFVPFHTYDIFSKLIIDTDTGLHIWSISDIKAHEDFISAKIKTVNNYLKSV